MELTPYVEKLQAELAVAAETAGEEARALAERLAVPLESAIRLTLLEALSAAADEITRELAPGSVEVRLRGLNPAFVVNTRQSPPDEPLAAPATAPAWDDTAGEKGATSRINLRLPDELKARIDEAAARERLSANSWLVRAAAAALDAGAAPRPAARPGGTDLGRRYTGWAR
ncbi:ribbon-helix-helix protein, CopG family [Catellatospora chokoriensis]|uniref:Ribbon-helix-helix protein CopG domain-containing protein n=1 Tax=Catellatospora chokoriensis TaxID=310353 RepID=A0A8J3NTF9_9ACTN|nr:ribbon-helix-helix protein, CopG family [Catellatospora chokoriensis]GIF91676.1 hypothetical protein Cch02nite_51200 [Catellatospora chokoriensis]